VLARAQRGNLGAFVFFAETMFQAVLVVALGAAYGRILEGVYEGFALSMGTLVGVVDRWFFGCGAVFMAGVCSVAAAGPFTFARTLVRSFGPVV
jgi:hypothetical protein